MAGDLQTVCTLSCRVVKLSSCNLNYLIVIGAILLYGSVFPYGFSERDHHDAAHDALCNVQKDKDLCSSH